MLVAYLTDAELVDAARLGDKRAFEELIERHQQVVHRLAADGDG